MNVSVQSSIVSELEQNVNYISPKQSGAFSRSYKVLPTLQANGSEAIEVRSRNWLQKIAYGVLRVVSFTLFKASSDFKWITYSEFNIYNFKDLTQDKNVNMLQVTSCFKSIITENKSNEIFTADIEARIAKIVASKINRPVGDFVTPQAPLDSGRFQTLTPPVGPPPATTKHGPTVKERGHSVDKEWKQRIKTDQKNSQWIVNFYKETHTDVGKSTLQQIHAFTNDELEKDHHFIQWLFPTTSPSKAQPMSPYLTQTEVNTLRQDADFIQKLRTSFDVILKFYGLTYDPETKTITRNADHKERFTNWAITNPHNYLRMSRILTSLKLFGLHSEAKTLLNELQTTGTILQQMQPSGSPKPTQDPIPRAIAQFNDSLTHWKRAVPAVIPLAAPNWDQANPPIFSAPLNHSGFLDGQTTRYAHLSGSRQRLESVVNHYGKDDALFYRALGDGNCLCNAIAGGILHEIKQGHINPATISAGLNIIMTDETAYFPNANGTSRTYSHLKGPFTKANDILRMQQLLEEMQNNPNVIDQVALNFNDMALFARVLRYAIATTLAGSNPTFGNRALDLSQDLTLGETNALDDDASINNAPVLVALEGLFNLKVHVAAVDNQIDINPKICVVQTPSGLQIVGDTSGAVPTNQASFVILNARNHFDLMTLGNKPPVIDRSSSPAS